MAAKRRLAKVEGSLSAFETTLLWLEEAHAFGSLPAYVGWLIDQPIAAAPLVRVAEAAEDAVIRAMPRKSEDARAPTVRTAVREAAFRVELIIGLNRAAQELLEAGGLRCVALFWQRRALIAEGALGETNPGNWADWRTAVAELLTELYATEDARTRHDGRSSRRGAVTRCRFRGLPAIELPGSSAAALSCACASPGSARQPIPGWRRSG
jgi:hypothetical protein